MHQPPIKLSTSSNRYHTKEIWQDKNGKDLHPQQSYFVGGQTKVFGVRHAIERSRAALGHEAEMQVLRDRYASLTPREREVMALVASGLLNKQVGS